MRYYEYTLYGNSGHIEEYSEIRLQDYAYDSPIQAMNMYMYKRMDYEATFFVFREEGDTLLATFAYNERKCSFEEAYESVMKRLNEKFHITGTGGELTEITMRRFNECLNESKRRNYLYANKARATFSDWLYQFYNYDSTGDDRAWHNRYAFSEFIIPSEPAKRHAIYDKSFVDELANIEEHENTLDGACNMVHYVISSRGLEASCELSRVLAQSLYKANRISAGRVGTLRNFHPEVYIGNSHIEEIIENNFGGIVIIDLSARFGFDPEDYVMASKYIENLFKRYRNDCLFIFTYDMDDPGFAYYILPELKKYAIPVMLREGCGDRKTAVDYLRMLIMQSGYAKYADQAEEFMEQFPGDDFSQTDVLVAYEKFEPWCINKNILKAYDYDISGDFMLDRDENAESAYDRLNKLIGLDIVKKQIDDIITSHMVEKERAKANGRKFVSGSLHMVFAGNPGTAKTTVAELFAGIAKEKGILKSGTCVARSGTELIGHYAVKAAFTAAKGGVLFIDEAYAMLSPMSPSSTITALVQEIENKRDEVIVILAGYNDIMKVFMEANEGLKSRIPNWVEFPDYSTDELTEIFKLIVDERGFKATKGALDKARYIFEKARYMDDFGNGRFVRNLIDRAVQNQSVRLMAGKESAKEVNTRELFVLKKEDITALDEGKMKERPMGTARKELDDMVGLSSVKKLIGKAIANYNMNRYCLEKGIAKDKASLHMVFTGNPGTAKTTVARLFGEILKDEKVLPSGHFVEAGRADLVGQFSGHTPIKVKEMFRKAKGGVLFIDEAYALCDWHEGGYGDEAINTIVQEMENHRDDTIVVFAGYPKPMQQFLDRNPGMRSRIAFQVEFEDYTTDELCDITRLMASNKKMTLTDAAMEKLREIYDRVRGEADFGNGRFVRKMLEEAEMNIAQSLVGITPSKITRKQITTIDECHIPDRDPECDEDRKAPRRIGFVS